MPQAARQPSEGAALERPARPRARRQSAFVGGRCRVLALAVGLLAGARVAAASAPSPVPGVIGQDDRTIVETSGWPWGAIGRLNSVLGGFCTGTVIGPRKVLTAAHCLWNQRTQRWLPACALHYLAGYRRGEYLGHALVASFRVSPDYRPAGQERPADPSHDWAVLYLADGLPGGIRPVEVMDFSPGVVAGLGDDAVLVRAGYGRDRRHVLRRHEGCRVRGWVAGGRRLLHDCDATFGDSGSPILIRRGEDYRLVALHVANVGGGRQTLGVAVPSSAFRETAEAPAPPLPPGKSFEACSLSTEVRVGTAR